MMKRIYVVLSILAAMLFIGVALAQANPVVITDPSTWFQSQATIFTAAALITPWITKVVTALGKDWFKTDGRATQYLSLAVAAIIAGVGGWLSLGFLAGAAGWQGALQGAILTIVAFIGSNGMAKAARQEATSGALRAAGHAAALQSKAASDAQSKAEKAAALVEQAKAAVAEADAATKKASQPAQQ